MEQWRSGSSTTNNNTVMGAVVKSRSSSKNRAAAAGLEMNGQMLHQSAASRKKQNENRLAATQRTLESLNYWKRAFNQSKEFNQQDTANFDHYYIRLKTVSGSAKPQQPRSNTNNALQQQNRNLMGVQNKVNPTPKPLPFSSANSSRFPAAGGPKKVHPMTKALSPIQNSPQFFGHLNTNSNGSDSPLCKPLTRPNAVLNPASSQPQLFDENKDEEELIFPIDL